MPASAHAMLMTPYDGGSSPTSLASKVRASFAARSNADGSSAVQAIVRIDFMTCLPCRRMIARGQLDRTFQVSTSLSAAAHDEVDTKIVLRTHCFSICY